MRFRVGRDALGEAVAFVSRALPSRPVVPLLSGILIEAAPDALIISCFDYEVSARCRVDGEVIEPGTALVPGRLLAEITRSLPARPVECSRELDLLNLVCGSAEFSLVCLPADDYPALPGSPGPVGTVDGGALAVAVSQVASSASRDDTLPMLTAIFVDIDGDLLTLAATDRYRLAARKLSVAPAEPELRAVALVPARIMVEATRMMGAGVPVTLAFDVGERTGRAARQAGRGGDEDRPHTAEGLISFEVGDRRLTARLISGDFIKYQSRLAGEYQCHADLAAGPVIEAVRRASLVAERAGPVRLTFSAGRVMIEAHAEGRARAVETITADFAGDQPSISFNPGYLLDGLLAASVCAAADSSGSGSGSTDESGEAPAEGRIRLQFNTAARPALITWVSPRDAEAEAPGEGEGEVEAGAEVEADDVVPGFRYLLVPLRVPDRA